MMSLACLISCRCAAENFFSMNSSTAMSVALAFDQSNGVADGLGALGFAVGDLDAELLLESHREFHDVEAVRAEVVDEIGVVSHLLGFDPQMLDDDSGEAFTDAHCIRLPLGNDFCQNGQASSASCLAA